MHIWIDVDGNNLPGYESTPFMHNVKKWSSLL